MQKFNIKKGDNVLVLSGNDNGATGKVLKIFLENNRIIVEKVNLRKKSQRKSQDNPQGGIVEKEMPINISNVQLICNKCSKPTRTGRLKTDDGKSVRICKKCKEIID
jgi:large subunit ribosomal protein L24